MFQQQVSFWPEEDENGGSELTMSSQLRKTRSMDSSCLELRLGPTSGHQSASSNQNSHMTLPSALSRARSEANIHASSLSLGPGIHIYIYANLIKCKSPKNSFMHLFQRAGCSELPLTRDQENKVRVHQEAILSRKKSKKKKFIEFLWGKKRDTRLFSSIVYLSKYVDLFVLRKHSYIATQLVNFAVYDDGLFVETLDEIHTHTECLLYI